VLRGSFVAGPREGASTIEVRSPALEQPVAERTVVVRANARAASAALPLAALASAHRGINVAPDRVGELDRFLRAAIPLRSARLMTRPMRSAWWIVPFAACLCGEWWLRRRRGLR